VILWPHVIPPDGFRPWALPVVQSLPSLPNVGSISVPVCKLVFLSLVVESKAVAKVERNLRW
jgi:hypothetical protein